MSVESAAQGHRIRGWGGVGAAGRDQASQLRCAAYPGGHEGGQTESLSLHLLMEQRDIDRRVFFLLLCWEISVYKLGNDRFEYCQPVRTSIVQGSFATDMIHCGLVVYAVVYVSV